jgi:glycosyltransferase involved in cell wall biosynthesis
LADYISIPSNYVKRTFIQNGISENKLIVNPYGVNFKEFKSLPKKDNIFRVINVGAFSIRKGSKYILEAFYDLNLPNSEFVHVGTVKDEVNGFVNKYKRNNIKYLGQQPQQELFKYYSQASVFVLMSLEEGLAMVQSQAMACGLPIICSENTGGEDLLTKDGEEGFVIKIRNVDALKEKLLYLYQNQDICKIMGNRAKKRMQQGFSWDDYGIRYANNLVDILEKNEENTI